MKYIKLYEQADIIQNDPYNEEDWDNEGDDITKFLKQSIMAHVDNVPQTPYYQEKFQDFLEYLSDIEGYKIYEIVNLTGEYTHDVICYVRARSMREAVAISYVNEKVPFRAVFDMGANYRAWECPLDVLNKRKRELESILHKINNIVTVNDAMFDVN